MSFRRPDPNPRPSFTPPSVIWTVHQLAVHAAPALDLHIRRMQRMRMKVETMLAERSWNATQNEEATAILDHLARIGVIYAGEEPDVGRDEGGKFIAGEDHGEPSQSEAEQ